MRKTLISLSVGEVVALVLVLAGYLIAIAAGLRRVSTLLGRVTFGVAAIDKQTQPIGPALRDINSALGQVAASLEAAAPSKTRAE
ncbi:MAG: hypothetical protein M3P40_11875 [Actinomycetota bacterium]|nr:hypothetical protein [Actinomycetota bacterium]